MSQSVFKFSESIALLHDYRCCGGREGSGRGRVSPRVAAPWPREAARGRVRPRVAACGRVRPRVAAPWPREAASGRALPRFIRLCNSFLTRNHG